jgi:hypothetical protein
MELWKEKLILNTEIKAFLNGRKQELEKVLRDMGVGFEELQEFGKEIEPLLLKKQIKI